MAIPVEGLLDATTNRPTNHCILGAGVTSATDDANIYTTSAAGTTLKPFDVSVTMPSITGTVSVNSAGQSNPTPITVTPPSILLHYIIAAVGVLPTY